MVLNASGDFLFASIFVVEMSSYTKNPTIRLPFSTEIANPPHQKSTMRSTVLTILEGMNMKKQTKTKIEVGSVVKANVGELE